MSTTALTSMVSGALRDLVKRQHFVTWLSEQRLDDGDLVIINNSFVFRDKKAIKTRKSERCLCLRANGGALTNKALITKPGDFDADFKHLSSRGRNLPAVETLDAAIKTELEMFGKLSFVLIGEIRDEPQSAEIKHGYANELRFDPGTSKTAITTDADGARRVVVRDLSDPEAAWDEIQPQVAREIGGEEAGFRDALDAAFDALRGQAVSRLDLPTPASRSSKSSFLMRLTSSVVQQRQLYEQALKAYEDSGEAIHLNDALRVAYNFADDAVKVLQLLISLSDLKPVILWSSVLEHLDLAMAFKQLPWARVTRKKASLSVYQEIIGGARNRAFHNLLAFDRPIRSDLGGVRISARSLTLLPAYGKKSTHVPFDYEDRELVEVLRELTIAPEAKVTLAFWKRNVDVMKAFETLLRKVDRALWKVHEALL